MAEILDSEIERLENLSLRQLRRIWESRLGQEPLYWSAEFLRSISTSIGRQIISDADRIHCREPA